MFPQESMPLFSGTCVLIGIVPMLYLIDMRLSGCVCVCACKVLVSGNATLHWHTTPGALGPHRLQCSAIVSLPLAPGSLPLSLLYCSS